MWGYDRVTTLDDVKKTKDATIHVIETASDRGSWYRGGPATVRGFVPGGKTPIGKNGQFGGYHPGLAMTLFADGRVQPLSEKTEESVFAGMATITAEK
jgi:prepilin-type processing-associated H-X9-DG protein